MDTGIPAVANERGNDLHDSIGRKQAPEGMGSWVVEPSSLAGVDSCGIGMGTDPDERSFVDCVRQEPSEMEQIIFAEAVWKAFAQCFITYDEAVEAISDLKVLYAICDVDTDAIVAKHMPKESE
jgi:hypothetical protein